MAKLTQFQIDRLKERGKRDFGWSDKLKSSAFESLDMWTIYSAAYDAAQADHKAREEFRKTLPKSVQGTELELGDVVRLNDWGFSDAIVERIDEGQITFARPYMHANDVAYIGNRITTYVGLETFSTPIGQTFTLLSRQIMRTR